MLIFKKHNSHGFTLLEILLVIGIIAILAGIVIVAINPSKQLAVVRNTERKSDLKQLYNAITQYYIDNSAFPPTISTTTLNEVCNTGSVASTTTALNGASCGTLANLSVLVPTYLTAIPTDPTGTSSLLSFIPTAYAATTATGTGYKVGVNTAKQVLISAPLAELGVTVVVGNVPTVATWVPISGLVAHWKMNDNADNYVVDDNIGTNDGTSVRKTNVTTDASGRISTALTFNGSSDYISVANNDNLNFGTGDFSIFSWVYLDTVPVFGRIASKSHWNVTGAWAFGCVGDWGGMRVFNIAVRRVGYINDFISQDLTSVMTTENWHHMGVTRTSGVITFYLDGISYSGINVNNAGAPLDQDLTTADPLKLGVLDSSSEFLDGNLDDVRIYNRALTSTEITQLYNNGAGTEAE
jgi:prepilin-type N-terminal cleavage/methylation domain-containing protein